jgi:hypothetical protein
MLYEQKGTHRNRAFFDTTRAISVALCCCFGSCCGRVGGLFLGVCFFVACGWWLLWGVARCARYVISEDLIDVGPGTHSPR